MSRLQAYVTSRLLAALVVAVPLALWAFVPRDENGVEGFGVFYLTVGSAVVLAVVAAFAADWSTRVPLQASAGWLLLESSCWQISSTTAWSVSETAS